MFDQTKKSCDASFASFSRLKTGANKKGKGLGVKSILFPILTYYALESLVMTERERLPMQTYEMRFLRKVDSVTMFD